jgi:type IV secretory pathway TraG/TraD family ATPase VirD4
MTSNDREFWSLQAKRALTTLMHAAAVGALSMRDVLRWVAAPDDAGQEISRLLARSPAQSVDDTALQFLTTNPNTRTSITSTMMPALDWLSDDTAAAAAGQSVDAQVVLTPDGVDTPPAPVVFSAEELISRMGTVYLLGRHEEHIGPLVTAFTADIARKARDMASRMPAGRLSPALTFALDEAALICPIPLDDWTADMGGRNITIHIAAQSLPQIRQRWGHDGAAAILNNANTVLLFGGTRDPDDLQGWATLIGERDELVPSYDAHGGLTGQSMRKVPVLSPSQIANLPERRVVVVRRGMPPAIGRVEWAWKRRAVRVALKAQPNQTPAAAAVSSWSDVTEVQSAAAGGGDSVEAGASTAEPPRKGSEDRSAKGHAATPRSEPSSA